MYGIVTFHDGLNFGAYLQVYALQKTLRELDLENVVINYKNVKHWKAEYRCFLWTKSPRKFIRAIGKIIKFKVSQRKMLQTKFSFDPAVFEKIKFNGIFFGADEIWNCVNPLFKWDSFYFGEYFAETPCIAYAVSCGTLTLESGFPPEVHKWLRRFRAIGVRDDNTLRLVKEVTGIAPPVVLDPTLLWDFNGSEKIPKAADYILVYTIGLSAGLQKAIRQYADSIGKKLISVGYFNSFCDQNIIAIDPFEFLGYVKQADKIITSMFHGVLFSLKYKREFCIIVDPYRTNKLEFILNNFALHGRVVDERLAFSEIFSRPIDHNEISKVLIKEKVKSIQFIRDSVLAIENIT